MNLNDLINNLGSSRRPAAPSASQRLKQWWIAERQSPVLLRYQHELLTQVTGEVRRLRDHIEETSLMLLEDSVLDVSHDVKIELLVVETELERAKFIVRAYIRTRMQKIDAFPYFYLEQQQQQQANADSTATATADEPPMSKDEWIYCHRHSVLRAEHYSLSFLAALPEDLQGLTEQDGSVPMIEQPDLQAPVFVRVRRSPPNDGIVDVAGESVQLEAGGVYILRYASVMGLMDYIDIV